jgi:hypothetical protein
MYIYVNSNFFLQNLAMPSQEHLNLVPEMYKHDIKMVQIVSMKS